MAFVGSTTQSSLKVMQAQGSIKPAWLYELLPFLYITSGVVVILKLSGALAITSGVLLVATGILVLHMRRENRKNRSTLKLRSKVAGKSILN